MQSEPTLAAPEVRSHDRDSGTLVTTTYVLVTAMSAGAAPLSFVAGNVLAVATALLSIQLVFLAPYLRRRLRTTAVWVMVGVSAVGCVLLLLFFGPATIANVAGRGMPPTSALLLHVGASLVLMVSPGIAVTAGSMILGTAVAAPQRRFLPAVVGCSFVVLVGGAYVVAAAVAPG